MDGLDAACVEENSLCECGPEGGERQLESPEPSLSYWFVEAREQVTKVRLAHISTPKSCQDKAEMVTYHYRCAPEVFHRRNQSVEIDAPSQVGDKAFQPIQYNARLSQQLRFQNCAFWTDPPQRSEGMGKPKCY